MVRHIPERTCVVCRRKFPKPELTRLVRTESGLVLDLGGKQNGRGAYLCADDACWDRARTTNVLGSALRGSLSEADRAVLDEAQRSRITQ